MWWRGLVILVAGIFTAGVATMAVEQLSVAFFPMPETVDFTDPAQLDAWVDSLPVGAKLMVMLAWAVGSFCGGLVAGYMAEDERMKWSLGVGAFQQAAGIFNLIMLPHPWWMAAGSVLCFVPFAALGGWLSGRLADEADPMPLPGA